MKTRFLTLLSLTLAFAFITGCSKNETSEHKHDHDHDHAGHHHEHKAPHGGATVELGKEEYHVEFVRDGAAGKLQAFVMDGELEKFVRIAAPSLEVAARVADREEKLSLQPVASNATGETIGDTSLFEAQADWVKAAPEFDAVLKEITVRAKTYTNISFNFPKGSHEEASK